MKNHPNGQPSSPRAAVAEPPAISESLRQFRSQSPSESLGLPTGNNLTRPFIQATVITAVIFAALTVGPYLFDSSAPAETKGKAANSAEKQEPGESPKGQPTESTPKSPIANSGKPPAGKSDILDKLGENSKKSAPAAVNPLDKKDDDLLKDIK
jgi:hypothetical protein